ncbi:Alpha/Beta hydrolase protein [Dissophora ornata]|nr:hypothetical protein BGZ58_001089 [Dissophora ornata]KAI8603776.1 Alpha/Beta hydrolase protein [Dissophora ornata]
MSGRPQINIQGYGTVQGFQPQSQPSVAKFLNIPYATVTERWRPAVKAAPWPGIRDCSVLGPACPQPYNPSPLANLTNDPTTAAALASIQYSEEHCLNMNIYAPLEHLTKAKTLIPVMVWIHGGGFLSGSNALPIYDGTNFVARSIQLGRPIILVTINYRLNYLGFMSSRELVQDVRKVSNNSSHSVGNWGLLDQKMALEWVRDHIHVFGGNAGDVTAFGESAGANSIGYHLVIPEHHGLFQRAIMQSGAITTMAAGRPESEGQRYFDHLCQYHFKPDDRVQGPELSGATAAVSLTAEEKLERLKTIPATELVKAGDKGKVGMFIPTIDDVLIKRDARETVNDPTRYDPGLKSVMTGDCRDEGVVFVPVLGAKTLKRWDKFRARYCPPINEAQKEFEAIYGVPKTDKDARRISSEVLRDAVFVYPNHATSVALMRARDLPQGGKGPGVGELEMVRYHFDRPLKMLDEMGFRSLGAYHASELPFVFGSDSSRLMLSQEEKELSQRMMDVWILFAWGESSRQYGLRHGVRSLLPRDTPATGASTTTNSVKHEGGGLWQEAVVFTEACTVERGLTERMDQRKVEFWFRYEQWVRKRRAGQHAARTKQALTKL